MLTQVGTAIGMLIFVPLGDSRDRRALLTLLLSGAWWPYAAWRRRGI
jgi:hypothetical protein